MSGANREIFPHVSANSPCPVFLSATIKRYLCDTMAEFTEQQALKEREKYISAFNDTMVKIWKEQIILLGVIDTGRLLESPVGIRCDKDERITAITLSQSFLEYGLWQNYGTGREVPRGNPGDIGRDKVRKKRPWFSKKFYASFMNIKEFMADSLGREFLGIVSDALDADKMRKNTAYYRNQL